MFKKIEINIPFSEALTQMPQYEKFMKYILSKKIKITKEGILSLTATCSAVIQKTLPEKMQDSGSFTIPYKIRDAYMGKSLCDSRASINLMPLSVAKRLSLGELTPTAITLQMADRTLAHPEGILEDVLVTPILKHISFKPFQICGSVFVHYGRPINIYSIHLQNGIPCLLKYYATLFHNLLF